MANFLAMLISSIKQQEDVKHMFMGEYGVVIAIFKKGEPVWVESTWGMGFKELRRALLWGGGRHSSRQTPLEDLSKRNVNMERREVLKTLLTWEQDILSLPDLEDQAPRDVSPEMAQALYNLVPGAVASREGPVGGPGFLSALEEIGDTKFTGFLRFTSPFRGLIYIAGGRAVASLLLNDRGLTTGKACLNWIGQQTGIQYQMIKSDLFTVACLAVPFLPGTGGEIPPDALEEYIKKSQTDIRGLHLLHLYMKGAHALGMIYREVYAGTLAKKKGEERASPMPMAVLLRLAMLPGAKVDFYRYEIPPSKES